MISKREKIVKVIVLILLIVTIGLTGYEFFTGGYIDKIKDHFTSNSFDNEYNEMKDEISKKSFNSMEMYSGETNGFLLKSHIDSIITSNHKNKRQINVKYKDSLYKTDEEIRNFRKSLDENKEYDFYFEYDEDGYINMAVVEDL